jgi:hypothetical protein
MASLATNLMRPTRTTRATAELSTPYASLHTDDRSNLRNTQRTQSYVDARAPRRKHRWARCSLVQRAEARPCPSQLCMPYACTSDSSDHRFRRMADAFPGFAAREAPTAPKRRHQKMLHERAYAISHATPPESPFQFRVQFGCNWETTLYTAATP